MSATRASNSPKRARFSDPVVSSQLFASPSSAAESEAAFAAASLPTKLIPYSINMAKQSINAYRLLHEQQLNLINVTNENTIPRSARTKFSLTTQKRFEQDPEYKELQKNANDEVAKYQLAIKGIIVKKINFEISKLKEEAVRTIVHAAFRLIKMYLLAKGVPHNDGLAKRLIKLSMSDSKTSCIMDYDTSALIAELLAEEEPNPSTEHLNLSTRLNTNIFGILVNPIKVFREKDMENKLIIRIRSLATLDIVEDATAATAMAVDIEPTAPPESIRDEVRKQILEVTKTFQSKLDLMSQSLKKEKEGQSPSASSIKKKKGNKNVKNPKGQAGAKPNVTPPATVSPKPGKTLQEKKLKHTKQKAKDAQKK